MEDNKEHIGPIAVFDSGKGGVSVLYECIKLLPKEEYIYFSDSANLPYGIRTSSEIRDLVLNHTSFMMGFEPKALLIACNTATSVVVEELRERYRIPIIGMEPAVKPAAELSSGKKILVTATNRTLKEEKLDNLISGLKIGDRVQKMSLQNLVGFAEDLNFESEELEAYLRECFSAIQWEEFCSIVLGCTHFIYFKNLIRKILPEHISLIDGNYGTAKRLKELTSNSTSEEFSLQYYDSMVKSDFEKLKPYLDILDRA